MFHEAQAVGRQALETSGSKGCPKLVDSLVPTATVPLARKRTTPYQGWVCQTLMKFIPFKIKMNQNSHLTHLCSFKNILNNGD